MLAEDQIGAMQRYSWPGNVRELRNIIEKSILVHKGPAIEPMRLVGQITMEPAKALSPAGQPKIETLETVEKRHIAMTLKYLDGNHTRTANALGISRSTLMRKIKTCGL